MNCYWPGVSTPLLDAGKQPLQLASAVDSFEVGFATPRPAAMPVSRVLTAREPGRRSAGMLLRAVDNARDVA